MIEQNVMQKRGEYWANRIRVFHKEEVPNGCWVFIGDSLTERFPLEQAFPQIPCVNRGIGGDHADGLWERRELLGLGANPQGIFVLIGINDLLFNYKRDEIPGHLAQFIGYCQEQTDAPLTLISICPVKDGSTTTPAEIQGVNRQIQALAEEVGAQYLDLYSLMADEHGHMRPEYTIDGIHLSPAGYELWTQAINEMDDR